jgi:hypothetical protein
VVTGAGDVPQPRQQQQQVQHPRQRLAPPQRDQQQSQPQQRAAATPAVATAAAARAGAGSGVLRQPSPGGCGAAEHQAVVVELLLAAVGCLQRALIGIVQCLAPSVAHGLGTAAY